MRTVAYVVVTILVAVSPPAASPVQQQVSQSAVVAADVGVEIYNIAGSVRVTGWDRDEVRVEGTLGAGVERLLFEHDPNGVEIKVVVPGRRGRNADTRVGDSHLDIMVPRRAGIVIETLVAAIEVEGVDGDLRMESSVGDLTYSGGARQIEADSAGGDILLNTSATDAAIDVEGVAGSVLVQLSGGSVDASTLSGGLRIIGGRVAGGNFESVSGAIYFEGEIAAGAELEFGNFNGDIELLLPPDTSASFDISTYSSLIETEFGYEGRAVEPYSPEQRADFTLGAGGADVSIATFSGVVKIRRR